MLSTADSTDFAIAFIDRARSFISELAPWSRLRLRPLLPLRPLCPLRPRLCRGSDVAARERAF